MSNLKLHVSLDSNLCRIPFDFFRFAVRPFVDENMQSNHVTSAAKVRVFLLCCKPLLIILKFTPFMDPDARKTPTVTPRLVLGAKDLATPSGQNGKYPNSVLGPLSTDEKPTSKVFSKISTPAKNGTKFAPHRNNLKPETMDTRTFKPFAEENAKTPFKVFSRPGEITDYGGIQAQNVFKPFMPKTMNAAFTPFVDKTPAFTPFRQGAPLTDKMSTALGQKSGTIPESTYEMEDPDVLQEHIPKQPEDEEDDDQYDEEQASEHPETPVAEDEIDEEYEDEEYYKNAPLGGRFGQFNVMTPITERTCEYTLTTTPKNRCCESGEEAEGNGSPRGSVFIPPQQIGELEALRNAERLAAELQEAEKGLEHDEGEEHFDGLQLQPQSYHAVGVLEERTAALTLAEKLSLGQSTQFPNPCNPFEPAIVSSLLSRIPSDAHFHDLHNQTSDQLESLQKFAKRLRKTSGVSNHDFDLSTYTLTFNGHRLLVSEKLGEGGYGSVFKAKDLGNRTPPEDDEDNDDLDDVLDEEESASLVAVKVVRPRNTWEYHVLRCLHSSLPSSLRRSLVLPHALYAYSDESFLILDLCPQGMLLNVINNAVSAGVSQQGACLDELLVMFFSIELIRLVEGIHTAGFIHGDLKIDNCLLRLEDIPEGASAWNATYQPSGDGGWSYKGLKVIDFGRTIDTKMFPSGQEYIADWPTDERDCFEMREGRPWTFQTDYFGLVGIIYCMLFGKYIQASSVILVPDSPTRRYKIGTPLKRYWQGDLWNRIFDVLLNPCLVKPDGTLPICDELALVRKEMEMWLQANCNRSSNTLKGLLKKVEKSCYIT